MMEKIVCDKAGYVWMEMAERGSLCACVSV